MQARALASEAYLESALALASIGLLYRIKRNFYRWSGAYT